MLAGRWKPDREPEMGYDKIAAKLEREDGVEQSTMMKTPCLRYKGDFMAMMLEKEDSLIVKVSPARVDALIESGDGREFNFTKKKFKEWVLIPREFEDKYEAYIREALDYAKTKGKQHVFKLGIVGLGAWGKRLVNSVHGKSDTVTFTAAATRTPSKVAEFTAERNIRITAAAADIYGEVDGIVIAGHAAWHASDAMAAVEAGKPVLVIKPLATTKADAEALCAKAAEKGVIAAMGYDRCFAPAMEALRKRVAAGDLGRIFHASGDFSVDRMLSFGADTWKADPETNPPGSLADHMMYMMIELMGPVSALSVDATRQVVAHDFSDTASVTLRFAGGQTGTLTAIGVAPNYNRLHVYGEKGWAEMRGTNRLEYQPRDGEMVVDDCDPVDMCREQLERFAAAAQGKADWPVPPEDGINGVAALEAMLTSTRSEGAKVPVGS
jgi:predicted dehydrogenase